MVILLALALVLSAQVAAAGVFFFVFFSLFEREGLSSRRCRTMRACQRQYASPSSPTCPRSVQTAARVNERVSALFKWVRVFVDVQAVTLVFSEGGSAGSRCK